MKLDSYITMHKYFTAKRSTEDLILSKSHRLNGNIAQYLTNFQLDGVRFIYKNFEDRKACILNDESGLGKTVLVVAFLKSILPANATKKCLIIAKNDDNIQRWKFHLNTLGKITEKVLEDETEIDDDHSVYLIKASTLRTKNLSKDNLFNCIILDDRGEVTSNSKCMNYFLKFYENKISLFIASVDITLDLKKFHSILKLCGRIEIKYKNYKAFEQKFSLPKDIKNNDKKELLEAYFQRREKLINYCREFRLRRYCHQFEDDLPLIDPKIFANNVSEWKDGNYSLSLSSSGSIKLVSTSSEKDAETLFETFFNNKSASLVLRVSPENDAENNSRRNSETMEMPPLLVESDSEELNNENEKKETELSEVKPTQCVRMSRKRMRKKEEQDEDFVTLRQTRAADIITRSKARKNKNLISENLTNVRAKNLEVHRPGRPKKVRQPEEKQIIQKNSTQSPKVSPITYQQVNINDVENALEQDISLEHQYSKNFALTPDYDFGLDLMDKPLFTSNTSSELQIYPQDEEIIVLTSSIEDNTDKNDTGFEKINQSTISKDSARLQKKTKSQHILQQYKNSPSPDMFGTPDSNELTLAGKIKQNKMSNDKTRCLDILEKDFRRENTSIPPNACISQDLDTSISPSLTARSNIMKNGKITKYLIGSRENPRTNDISQQIENTVLEEADKHLKTPKNRANFGIARSQSTSKKTTKINSKNVNVSTPNSLTKWLMKTNIADKSSTKPKRKLDFWFTD